MGNSISLALRYGKYMFFEPWAQHKARPSRRPVQLQDAAGKLTPELLLRIMLYDATNRWKASDIFWSYAHHAHHCPLKKKHGINAFQRSRWAESSLGFTCVYLHVYLKGEWSLGKRCCDSTPLPSGIYWNQGDLQGAVKMSWFVLQKRCFCLKINNLLMILMKGDRFPWVHRVISMSHNDIAWSVVVV